MTNTNTQWAIEILEENMRGFDRGERMNYLEDVTQHGCISATVSGVIYTHDINNIFKDNMDDILEQLTQLNEELGYDVVQSAMTRLDYDKEYTMFPTVAVWMIIEDTAASLLSDLENEEEEEE
ncbi:hypothetical protein 000TH009_262 [Bacillus phage 000TH009]|nr:hypothetical protein 000TH009_4 [Bacillus phage 000TH009]QQO40955.1 hypothetical protein 000TH009_262 [Bacillus phage 000TH009]